MADEVRLNVNSSGPAIFHNGVADAKGSKSQGCRKETAVPSTTVSNEPEPSSTSVNVHSLIPAAAARFVVTFSPESRRTMPPSGEEEKLIEPEV